MEKLSFEDRIYWPPVFYPLSGSDSVFSFSYYVVRIRNLDFEIGAPVAVGEGLPLSVLSLGASAI